MNKYLKYKKTNIEWLDQIPEHWETFKIKDIAKVLTGATPKTAVEEYWNGKVNWVTTDDLGKLKGKYITKTRRTITQRGYNSSGVKLAKKKSIVLSTRAPIGHLGILDIESCSNQGCKTIEANNNFISEFVYYVLSISKDYLRAIGVGTTFIELTTLALKSNPIPLPPLPEQKAIADYLDKKKSNIDQIIEAKKKLISLYEEEKATLINQAVTKGIDPKVKMKPSGIEWLGDIPQHWEILKIKDFAKVLTGSTPRTSVDEYWNGDINWVTTDDLGKLKGKYIAESRRRISKLGFDNSGVKLASVNSIVLSTRAPIGHLGIIKLESCTNQGCKTIESNSNFNSEFIYYCLQSSKSYLNVNGVGTTFIELSTIALKSYILPFPPLKEQEKIVDYIEKNVSVIEKKIDNANRLIELLTEYRETLISEVVTGKVKVI